MTNRLSPIDCKPWRTGDFPEPRAWVHDLESAMVDEITEAARKAVHSRHDSLEPTGAVTPLSSLEPLLAQVREELESGPGFAVVAGFPVTHLSLDEIRFAYRIIMRHLGRSVQQNGQGEQIVDVIDAGREYSHRSRGYHGNDLLPFHTDGTKGESYPVHYAALLCLETAASGGLSALASGPALFEDIARDRPRLLPLLERGYHHHRQGDHAPEHSPV